METKINLELIAGGKTGLAIPNYFGETIRMGCAVVPDDGVIPENYDPDFFFDRYNSARNTRPEELLNRDEMSEEEYNRRLKLMSGFSDRAITARIRAKFDLK